MYKQLSPSKKSELRPKRASRLEKKVQQYSLELRDANITLLQQNEELLKSNKKLESFNYISSHNLQEPLRKISTYMSLLEETESSNLSEKGKALCRVILESVLQMRDLVLDLRNYTVLDSDVRKFKVIDLLELFDEVKYELQPLLDEKKGIIEVESICNISVNAFQFRQVLINLIGNAIKFSKAHTAPIVKIKSKQLHGEDLQNEALPVMPGFAMHNRVFCCLQISDNGIGFDIKHREKIFDVFRRLHKKEDYEGTGIGLAIVKKIVEYHNGFITCNSVVGEGSVFNIYLPLPDN